MISFISASIQDASVNFFNQKGDSIFLKAKRIEQEEKHIKAFWAQIQIKGRYNFFLRAQDAIYDKESDILTLRSQCFFENRLVHFIASHIDFYMQSYNAFTKGLFEAEYKDMHIRGSDGVYIHKDKILSCQNASVTL